MFGMGAPSAGLGAGMENRWAGRRVLGKAASSWTPTADHSVTTRVAQPSVEALGDLPPQPQFPCRRLMGTFLSRLPSWEANSCPLPSAFPRITTKYPLLPQCAPAPCLASPAGFCKLPPAPHSNGRGDKFQLQVAFCIQMSA